MKKSFIFGAALMLMGALSFQSCSQESNPGEPVTPPEPIYEETFVYDFAEAAKAGENPANFNGNQNNGQGFYGWEKADKTDSKRNDYKGYVKKEGSTLPEVCQIWRRSDRFDQDASWNTAGGVKMPNDREFAIDGLEIGSYVQIFYEGGDVVWAIGDGSSEQLEGARATALIDGQEAVTGETVIPSESKIVVTSVTPAVKGTGYIVFKVKKDMIISKIVIGNVIKL